MRLRKVCPQCNTVVHVKRSVCDCGHAFASIKRNARCTAVWEPENAMKRRKALLSEEELLVMKERDKVRKASKRASETCEQTLHRQEQNQTHLACAEGSALQCCSFYTQLECSQLAAVLVRLHDGLRLVQQSFHNDRIKFYTLALLELGIFGREGLKV